MASCSSAISEMFDYLEGGGTPIPYFFPYPNCDGPRWPATESQAQYDYKYQKTDFCKVPGSKSSCALPAIGSMIFPGNIRISITANSDDPIPNYIQEPGFTKATAKECPNAICANLINTGEKSYKPLTWYSPVCPDPGEKLCDKTATDGNSCKWQLDPTGWYGEKLMKSILSCGQPLWASFVGVNSPSYKPDADPNWIPCSLGINSAGKPNDKIDYCNTGEYCGGIISPEPCTLENGVYQTTRNPFADKVCSDVINFQSCANFANKKLILDTSTQRGDDFGLGSSTCYSLTCGGCRKAPGQDVSCVTGGSSGMFLQGTVKNIVIDLITDDGLPTTWDRLQSTYCLPGTPLKLAGITVQRYTGGTPICDKIMTRTCESTAQLTLDPNLVEACQCLLEEKRLQAQFAGISLPVQCFTTVCDITNPSVYKTAEQVRGCSARLCVQTLQVEGNNIMSQGFQEIICNGEVYNLGDIPATYPAPFVSVVSPSSSGLNVGPVFYIALGLLLMMLVLVTVWGIRRRRQNSETRRQQTAQVESLLLPRISFTKLLMAFSCSSGVSQMLDYLEGGGQIIPYFFSGSECSGNVWPNETMGNIIDINLTRDYFCQDAARCPLAAIGSMIVPDNIKIVFTANTRGNLTNARQSNVINTFVTEFGQTNVYSNSPGIKANIFKTLLPNSELIWNSASPNCSQKGETKCNPSDEDNCSIKPDTSGWGGYNGQKLSTSLISCGSTLYPSFIGMKSGSYVNNGTVTACELSPDTAPYKNFNGYCTDQGRASDYTCGPFEDFGNCETTCAGISATNPCTYPTEMQIYDTIRNPPYRAPDGCGPVNKIKQFYACAVHMEQNSVYPTGYGPQAVCNNGGLGSLPCYTTFTGTEKDPDTDLIYPRMYVDGSVESVKITYVDDTTHQPTTWERLQSGYCLPGTPLKLAGITVQRYTGGTPICDKIMTRTCESTAQLTLDPNLVEACQCLLEEKRLQAQFAGISLPVQCFTTVCDITNPSVYKTAEQVRGCSARLCTQTLQVEGNNIMSQGFQEIICNGEVYNLGDIPATYPAPFVSVVSPSSSGLNVGPVFYIALGLLLMMLVLVTVWGIRRRRQNNETRSQQTAQVESLLLPRIS